MQQARSLLGMWQEYTVLSGRTQITTKRAVKPESGKGSFEMENLQKWLHGQSHRAFEAERFPERTTIDETPAQTPANLGLQVGWSRFFHSKSPERKWKLELAAIWSVSLYQSLMEIEPSLNVSGLHFLTAWPKVANLQK